jgi:hypothetical protein
MREAGGVFPARLEIKERVLVKTSKPIPAGLGFRVKSGWAMAVLLVGTSKAPVLIKCQAVLLSDPKIPQSKQPYHAALELSEAEAKAVTKKLRKVVADAAKKSVRELLKEAGELKYEVRGAGLVVGSLVDPATLHNEHIRAHGLEGQLFRTALERAFGAQKISCKVLLEKTAYATASLVLGKAAADAKKIVASLGESHNGSWRAEEKLAALAAWMALRANE